MSGRCEECGASTTWDADVGSAICLQCGTLADPTQSVLASHLENTDVSGREYAPWSNIPGGSMLRGRNGWALSGQGKEARDRRNTIAMHDFIRTIATRLSSPGLATRAQGVFDQAMRLGQYRWGRKARLTAGAALAIALRESHKSDSIRDIAYLLNEPPVAISRAFNKVIALLQLGLSTTDPAVHLPALQAHLSSLLDGSGGADATLPAQLIKVLSPILSHLPTVMHTASALSGLLARTHTFAHLPTAPTACAMFMLALEAELSSSLPNAGAFAPILGTRLGVGKGVIMQRYKQIYDLVEEWIREVPWLDAHERKRAKGREGEGRSKVAKRVVVARGLKDVVRFQEDIWRKRIEHEGRPLVQLDIDEKDGGSGDECEGSEFSGMVPSRSLVLEEEAHARKKAKIRHPRTVVAASHFLLNPLSAATAISPPSPISVTGTSDLLTHLLTADSSCLPHAFVRAPTRLQLLASARGGTDEEHIADEELFAEDELEGLMRSAEEAETIRITMGWDADDANKSQSAPIEKSLGKGQKRKRSGGKVSAEAGSVARGSKKIDMEALDRLLNSEVDLDAVLEDGIGGPEIYHLQDSDEEDDEDGGEEEFGGDGCHEAGNVGYGAGGEEVIGEWRPPSPGGGPQEDWFEF